MSYIKGLSTPSATELETFENYGNLTASNAETLDVLFLIVARPPPKSHRCVGISCFLLCNIEVCC
jgi:hypothetical protein